LTAAALDTAQAFHLTDREKEVAALVAGGFKRAQIAGKLGISEATVKTHLQHLFEKTGTRRQIDLIKRLVEYTSAFA
jgi:DNA-binding CsgD family transcriptional regulator